ncbi:MAG: DUF998 domain-containing protein, partial [Intestinibacter sp.]|uniref:DUF998 domain-containing protein n=1 Tax=Intestinibacter sp. TaxID=1965304 RepID=UPI003F16DB33
MKRTLINYLGLLGVVSLLSYTAAVIFSPSAYPGYNWMEQAVSDLSANNAPSKMLWEQFSSLYGICGIISIMMVCVFIQGKLNKTLRIGIYLFAAMNWVSSLGYKMFPLSASGNAGTFQDVMHIYVVTVLVVLLSIISLFVIMIGGYAAFCTATYWNWPHALAVLFAIVVCPALGIILEKLAYKPLR